MNVTHTITAALNMLWWLFPVLLLLGILKTRWFKGLIGEALVKFAAKLRLPAHSYHRLHHVTLTTANGSTQIDHIFISRFGIFVVETKNMKGSISGGAHQAQWTQHLAQQTFTFQNPLRQNYKHILALDALLNIPTNALHSIVAFVGASTFKSPLPANVTRGMGYIAYIKSFREVVLSEQQVQDVLQQIQAERLRPSRATDRRHVKQLKKRLRHSAKTKCPECGSPMVVRTAQRGENTGNQFWGCSTYPKCQGVKNIK